MAILFCGIVMSHYTHFNLSAVTQVTVQQTFRTLAFMAGKVDIILGFSASSCTTFRNLCLRVPWNGSVHVSVGLQAGVHLLVHCKFLSKALVTS